MCSCAHEQKARVSVVNTKHNICGDPGNRVQLDCSELLYIRTSLDERPREAQTETRFWLRQCEVKSKMVAISQLCPGASNF